MKKMVLAALGAATLAGGLATAPLAFAQPAADAPRMSQREHRLPGERIDARLAYAKVALKITSAQEAQWNALADVLRKHARAMDEQITQRRSQPRDPSLSAIDRLQRRQEMMAAASARANEVLEVAKPLYAVLSDDQKKEADALLTRGDHRRGDHRGGPRSDHRDQRHGHGSRWH
jgi:hypothetical protein